MAKKLQLGYREIEERLQVFHDGRVPASEVGERLLFSFGKSERDIARYREGKGTLKTFSAGLLIKGLLCYQATTSQRLSDTLERLNRAYQLLLTTDKSVSEVAYAVGFTAPSYFTKCFKEEYGMVPGDVRK